MTILRFISQWLFGLKPLTPDTRDPGTMKPSKDCLELVKHFEGFYPKAYKCPAGVWTIGYGHTGLQHKDGTVFPGRTVTLAEADELLAYDLEVFSDRVNDLVKVPLTQNQFDALVSFDFNTGGLGKSSLLRKLNSGNYDVVPSELSKWNRGGGKVLRGLVRRRASESNLWRGIKPYVVHA